jgi:hypothetical protein
MPMFPRFCPAEPGLPAKHQELRAQNAREDPPLAG